VITEPGGRVPLGRSRGALSSGADARGRERFAGHRCLPTRRSLSGRLWIVEAGRVRLHD
jgi:hypothetical protein